MLFNLFIFFNHLLCILALPCIINEFYILIDEVKIKKTSLTSPTRLSRKCKCELLCVCVCMSMCVSEALP